MVVKESVNVNWQTIFAIIPVIDLWAAYRIEKLRLYLLVNIAMIVVGFLGGGLIFGDGFYDYYFGEEITDKQVQDYNTFSTVGELIAIGISIVLIRKWSKEWNGKIAENS